MADIPALKEAMEQSLAPGSQTFEQDLVRLYRSGVITLQEALDHADSPTNLSWLINNSEARPPAGTPAPASPASYEPSATDLGGSSYKEFTISLNEADEK